MKQLWILVGANGAGKSTFYDIALKPLALPFINADIIAKEVFPDDPEGSSYQAAKLAEALRYEQLGAGNSFAFETVFSHPSKIDFIAHAKALGYHVVMVVVHIVPSNLNKMRIAQRAAEGGHFVPEDKIEARIPRTLKNIQTAIPLCDEVRVLDNSSLERPYQPVLTIKSGVRRNHIEPLPIWAERLL